MKFLGKIEDLLNRLLLAAGAAICGALKKICPAPLAAFWEKYPARAWRWVVGMPARTKAALKELKDAPKLKVDYKGLFSQALEAGKKAYAAHSGGSPLRGALSALAAPFAFLYNWASELSAAHFMLLASATFASVLAVVGITLSSQRILERVFPGRAPASVEEADPYDRPEYYKRETRIANYNNLKIPVYVQGVEAMRALVIDFSVTASNRSTKKWIERYEFEVRDHLVMHLEPVLPEFPLTNEGRAMLAEKLRDELNEFLRQNQVEGHVEAVHIVYVLGH